MNLDFNTDNYFVFYGLPVSFEPDLNALKQQFYAYSKQFHPDFFAQESEDVQMQVLELSTFNNKAYKTLSHFDKRMKYVLELRGLLEENEKYQLPPSFLMEMMDINEALMELQMEPDVDALQKKKEEVAQIEANLLTEITPILAAYDENTTSEAELLKVKAYYYQKKYLSRISESIKKLM